MAVIFMLSRAQAALQRLGGFAVEEVQALLVELDPDRLVRLDRDGGRQADVDHLAVDEDLGEGDVAGRLDGVDAARDRAGGGGLVQLQRRVAGAEHRLAAAGGLRLAGVRVGERQLPAARRRAARVRPSAGGDLDRDQAHGRAADEAGDEGVDRVGEDAGGGVVLLQEAAVHHRHLVGHGDGLELVVGDVDDGGVEVVVEALDLRAHLHAELGVEVGERLVHQEDRRVAHQRAAEGDALLLAAGELAGLALEQVGDVEDLGGGTAARGSTDTARRPSARAHVPDSRLGCVFGEIRSGITPEHILQSRLRRDGLLQLGR